ncbi:FecR protein [Stieleria neptunia]|uniref:FecR protein n=1 Tax=Stieleria neptunia TaxID=2527979 RepID=A0A518I2Y7_9BACT|nr:FecR domain-containing protein [Stieleria neptunia]QDV47471.1 FecR protein [Stieleria neptunia]
MKNEELNLLHRYLDGAITPDELEPLEDLLRTSEEARATLRSLATIDAKWQQLATEELVAAPSDSVTASRMTRKAIPWWLTFSAIAASVIFGAFGWFRAPGQRAGEIRHGIARVIRIEGDGTTGKDRNVADGTELFAGEELEMQRGLIELAFRETGVHVVATAPLRMMLSSDQRVSLHEGQVKLVVPPQGVGFVVDTAQRKFVDLGTSFVVTAGAKGSEVLVLDGQISVDDHEGTSAELMNEGEFARFDRDGKLKKRTPTRLSQALPELSLEATRAGDSSLRGIVLGYESRAAMTKNGPNEDVIARELLPLIRSGFNDGSHLEALKQGEPLSFRGIAGAFHEFPDRTGLAPYSREDGWLVWYHGQVTPARAGRYRFWGYADNHLLLAINGKPVFEGSRKNSSFKELGIERTDNPALPCLIAPAGFACSEWVEVGNDPVRLDILFGEVGGNTTSGLLLVEREGETYEETLWGQPKWPLFLTETPSAEEAAEFKRLVDHLGQRTMGSFSVSEEAVWRVAE